MFARRSLGRRLDDPDPHPVTREAFPDTKLDLMSYSDEQWRTDQLELNIFKHF
jgi:hypothetical protein